MVTPLNIDKDHDGKGVWSLQISKYHDFAKVTDYNFKIIRILGMRIGLGRLFATTMISMRVSC